MFSFFLQALLLISSSFKIQVCALSLMFPFWGLQLLRPIYRQIAENQNAEIFSANTLLVILGTSLLTARVYSALFVFCFFVFGHSLGLVIFFRFLNRLDYPWHSEHFWLVCFLQKLNFLCRLSQTLLHIVVFYWASFS